MSSNTNIIGYRNKIFGYITNFIVYSKNQKACQYYKLPLQRDE
jgi:ribosomal protein S17E